MFLEAGSIVVLVFIQKNRFVEDTPSSLLAVEYGSRVRLFMRGYFVLKNGKCPKRHAFMFELSFQGTVVFVVFVFRWPQVKSVIGQRRKLKGDPRGTYTIFRGVWAGVPISLSSWKSFYTELPGSLLTLRNWQIYLRSSWLHIIPHWSGSTLFHFAPIPKNKEHCFRVLEQLKESC